MTDPEAPYQKEARERVLAAFNVRRETLAELAIALKVAEEEGIPHGPVALLRVDQLAAIPFSVDECKVIGLLDLQVRKWERLLVTTAQAQFVIYPDGCDSEE